MALARLTAFTLDTVATPSSTLRLRFGCRCGSGRQKRLGPKTSGDQLEEAAKASHLAAGMDAT
eukprot:CAMPEP_0197907418 /NCGR_PEP_ID=MMETSP1439-20131203/64798_1 /TAXON_ID=66791 /ORGANISM="Gonyaulax spinifera, Strain CCMP409" /LENGTH=62 /DNA_ID=CAMNT_0043528847 /DNA_START=33 /DNA_END=217 /DNA_ORIENTATION=+